MDKGEPAKRNTPEEVDTDKERQQLVEQSSPIDGEVNEVAIKETTLSDIQKGSAWLDLQLQEYREIIGHRKNWSDGLLLLVGFIVIVDFLIVVASGNGILTFENEWAIPTFIAANLAEVFGLSYIVVQYLFPAAKDSRK